MEANNGRLKGFKGNLTEGGIRTPWVMTWPARFQGGRVIATPVISLDILPTALDAAGVSPSKNLPLFDGKSLLPLLAGTTTQHHERLFWNSGEPKGEWAVRQGRWKAHGFKESVELYDLAADPSESTDLASSHADLARQLAQHHKTWHQAMKESAGPGAASNNRRERRPKGRPNRKR